MTKFVLPALLALASSAALAQGPAIQVSVNGPQYSAPKEDSQAVRQKISGYIENFQVSDYLLLSVGLDTDFSACFVTTSEEVRQAMIKDLKSTPVSDQTSLTVRAVERCARED